MKLHFTHPWSKPSPNLLNSSDHGSNISMFSGHLWWLFFIETISVAINIQEDTWSYIWVNKLVGWHINICYFGESHINQYFAFVVLVNPLGQCPEIKCHFDAENWEWNFMLTKRWEPYLCHFMTLLNMCEMVSPTYLEHI